MKNQVQEPAEAYLNFSAALISHWMSIPASPNRPSHEMDLSTVYTQIQICDEKSVPK